MTDSSTRPGEHRSGIVLASGSTYRAGVLRAAGWSVQIEPPDVDERAADGLLATVGPEGLALELARRKLAVVAPRHPSRVVVAADQLGVLGDGAHVVPLTKQPEVDTAVEQLCAMSGTTHRLVNGVVATADGGEHLVEGVDVVEVTMRVFSRAEAIDYVRRFEPFDTSGSYRIEDSERMAPLEPFVQSIHGGHPSSVVGMPLPLLTQLLEQLSSGFA
jgi:septum formation protein